MVADTELQGLPVLDIVQYRCIAKEITVASSAAADAAKAYAPEASVSQELNLRNSGAVLDICMDPDAMFVPSIRSGSFADAGCRTFMEDEHICIDDLSAHMGSKIFCPSPSAFYGVFDGHGGADAATYLRKHAVKFFIENPDFPRSPTLDNIFLQKVEHSLNKAFLNVDDALAEDYSINSCSGTTGLAALIFGRALLVANVGDCRAVLCRKGVAIDMSDDHRAIRLSERKRVESAGGYIEDGYLNGVLSVTRALGDWDIKQPRGSPSPLIAEPEFRQEILTEEDEFLIIGCDGIWDVMSSQHAVSFVRRGLRRHHDPAKCARELVLEALRLHTSDNLTVVIVCFTTDEADPLPSPQLPQPLQRPKLKCCSLSTEALCKLSSWLSDNGTN